MTKKEILDYIIETPGNTNRAVLSGMLDSFEGGSGGGGALIVEATYDSENDCYTLQSTWQEISDAFKVGTCLVHWETTIPSGTSDVNYIITGVFHGPTPFGGEGITYTVEFSGNSCNCTSPDGYPSSCSVSDVTPPTPDLGN